MLVLPALYPTAVLSLPVVFVVSASVPTAVLSVPVLSVIDPLPLKAFAPIATWLLPV